MNIIKLIKKNILKLIPGRLLDVRYRLLNISQISKIFLGRYGYLNSIKYKLPLNNKKEPIPWYTYPAIEYIDQFDLKDKIIFEYGSGYSSLYFAKNVKEITSVEDNIEWFEKINKSKPNNLNVLFKQEKGEYLSSVDELNKKFDIIVIDGRYRLNCCDHVKNNLNNGGMVILDNSDWYNDCATYLRDELNLIQVDFSGFGPINDYAWTTSLFFSRDFNFTVKNGQQPKMPIGGIK